MPSALAGRLEPVPVRGQLPEDRVQDRRPARHPPDHRRGYRAGIQLRGEDRRGHGRSLRAVPDCGLDKFQLSGLRAGGIEADQRQFGTVVGRGEGPGPAELLPPLAGQGAALVDMAVESQQGLLLLDEVLDGDAAEVAYSIWLGTTLLNQEENNWLRAFKYIIQQGFDRHEWNFNAMIEQAENHLSQATYQYAIALADAFLDKSKLPALDKLPKWKKLIPLDPQILTPEGKDESLI